MIYRIALGVPIVLFLLLSCQRELTSGEIIETGPPLLIKNIVRVNSVIGGFYSALPAHYAQSTQRYPLLVFIHGAGQMGNGSTDLPWVLNEGVPELLNNKLFPPSFTQKSKHFSFIVLAPQLSSHASIDEMRSFLEYAKKNYRIDTSRIYLSGMSIGSNIICNTAASSPEQFAAIVAMSGVCDETDITGKCGRIARGRLPVWVFQNEQDQISKVEWVKSFVARINDFSPAVPPRYTQFLPFGLNNHDSWTRATDPHYKEEGINIYEWMLQYSR